MDVVQGLLKAAAPDSVIKLIDLRDNPLTPPAVVRASCETLLDRYLGKPKQHVDVSQDLTPQTDVAKLDEELAKLTAETNRLLNVV